MGKNSHFNSVSSSPKLAQLIFRGNLLSWETSFYLTWVRVLVGTRCLGAAENKRAQWLFELTRNLQYYRHTIEWARKCKLMKKKPANLSYWEITHTIPEKVHPHWRFEKPLGFLLKVFPCVKLVHSRWLYFQMLNSQQKIMRHTKKQASVAQSKE